MTDTIRPDSSRHAMASSPTDHVWVSASAGTGKTSALTDRLVRLLLAGNPPDSILAITFTRTAAAEMRERIAHRLASWVRMPDAALADALGKMGEPPDADRLARARSLFATVLDSVGGLQILTIHSLAQSLLAAFPLEAGLPPGSEPLDDRSARLLLDQAFAQCLAHARTPAGTRLARDLALLAVESNEGQIGKLLARLAGHADGYGAIADPQRVEPLLRRFAGLPQDGSAADVLLSAMARPELLAALDAFASAMAACGTDAKQQIADMASALRTMTARDRLARMEDLHALVLTTKGERKSFDTVAKKSPGIIAAADALMAEVETERDVARAFAFVDHAGAWLRFGMDLSDRYARLKANAAVIDYDDMISRAGALLSQNGMLSWVNAKLDRRFRHILVDEAQDTNDAQWRIIAALAADFFAGEGAHDDRLRTQFVVGDYKQAIFGFQGTDPRVFARHFHRLTALTQGTPRPLRPVDLSTNFRSGPAVLEVVDRLIAQQTPQAFGLEPGVAVPLHAAARQTAGEVLLLPPWAAPDDLTETDGEDGDDAGNAATHPHFANALAAEIADWLTPGHPARRWLGGQRNSGDAADAPPTGRWAVPGDILILVRARGDLMARLVAALHARRIEVAGVDRMLLSAPIAVQDLLSLIRFVLQPADDLALAEILTSPLAGRTHEDVRKLRQGKATLWQSLRDSADPAWEPARALLLRALRMADNAPPHAFLQSILAEGGRAAFYHRLGREAADGIDTLLAEALLFERTQPPGLQGFLRWIDEATTEVKRDPDSAPGRVRIMTIHGAKGLQAPIVLLADAMRSTHAGDRLVSASLTGPAEAPPVPLIFGKAARSPQPVSALWKTQEARQSAEAMRLLYVALTRAEDVLVVAGQAPKRTAKNAAPLWHDMVRDAMGDAAIAEPDPRFGGERLRLPHGPQSPPAVHAPPPAPPPAPAKPVPARPVPARPVPDWARQPAPAEIAGARPYTPSAPAPDSAPLPPPTGAMRAAARRGTLLHRLFERLPDVAPPARAGVAVRVALAAGFTAQEADDMAQTALAVLETPDFAALFGPTALAEAPLAGQVGGRAIAGTVDRLLIGDSRILVVDFKTGLAVPPHAAAVHPGYVRQMAAYRAVLRAAFPQHSVSAALLFTAAPKLIYLPDNLLDIAWGQPDA